jgi:competence protein ComEC
MPAHRALNSALLGFLTGIALASFVVLPVWALWTTTLGGCLALAVRNPKLLAVGCWLLAAALGMWRTEARLERPSALLALADSPATLAGFVDDDFKRTENGGRYAFRVLEAGGMRVSERIMVYGPPWVRPRYGQELTLTGTLRRPENRDDGFDYVSWLAKSGIAVQMSYPVYGVPERLDIPLRTRIMRDLGSALRALRYEVHDAVLRAVPQPAAGYMLGILVGDEADIEPALREIFSRTGTSHILVVSGYNITIVAAAFMAALSRLGRRRAYWMAVAGVIAFTVLVGASPSVVRAAIMGILALTARELGRAQNAGSAVVLSAALMGAQNPLVVRWDTGFQLSFLAVLGLVYLEPILRPFWTRAIRFRPLAEIAAATTAAQLAVLPLLVFQFGTLASYALPVNMLVLPFVPLAMALAAATAAAGIIWPFLGALVGQLAWLVAAVQLSIIRFAGSLPYATLEISFSAAAFAAAYAGLATYLILWYHKAAIRTRTK